MSDSMQEPEVSFIEVLAKALEAFESDEELRKLIPTLNTIQTAVKMQPSESLKDPVLVLRMDTMMKSRELDLVCSFLKKIFNHNIVALPVTINLMEIEREKLIEQLEATLNFIKRNV